MKKFFAFFLILTLTLLVGCGQKELSYGYLERDSYSTGGAISFSYDELTHTAYFGGEGESIEWYEADVAKDWKEAGNRIGIKITPPKGLDDYKSATATLNGEKLEYSDIYAGDDNKYAIFQPIVNEETPVLTLKIKWQESAAEQSYSIVIKSGTLFMQGV